MGDNHHYNKYSNEFQPPSHYQVKANVASNNGSNQQFSYDVNAASHYHHSMVGAIGTPGFESNTHLSSLSNCVKRLQTQLNQYLTKIIDEGSDGPTNYNLGSGEVLNSHLMEQYSTSGGGGGTVTTTTSGTTSPITGVATAPSMPINPSGHSSYGHQTISAIAADPAAVNNGYSYYSNYPTNYPAYPTGPNPYHPHTHHHPAMTSAVDYYNQQSHHLLQQQQPLPPPPPSSYANFQEPKSKKQKNK